MTSVNIETNHGNISFNLLPELAPETVRRVARDLRNELLEKIQILQSDTKTSTATVEATAEQ